MKKNFFIALLALITAGTMQPARGERLSGTPSPIRITSEIGKIGLSPAPLSPHDAEEGIFSMQGGTRFSLEAGDLRVYSGNSFSGVLAVALLRGNEIVALADEVSIEQDNDRWVQRFSSCRIPEGTEVLDGDEIALVSKQTGSESYCLLEAMPGADEVTTRIAARNYRLPFCTVTITATEGAETTVSPANLYPDKVIRGRNFTVAARALAPSHILAIEANGSRVPANYVGQNYFYTLEYVTSDQTVTITAIDTASMPKYMEITPTADKRLKACFAPYEADYVQSLNIKGELRTEDFYYMRDSMPALLEIDMREATVTSPRQSIPERAFENNTRIQTILLPENTTSLGSNAFYCCQSLHNIMLPAGLNQFGLNQFGKSGVGTGIVCALWNPYEHGSTSGFRILHCAFANTGYQYTGTLCVANEECVNAYKAVDFWSEFKTIKAVSPIDLAKLTRLPIKQRILKEMESSALIAPKAAAATVAGENGGCTVRQSGEEELHIAVYGIDGRRRAALTTRAAETHLPLTGGFYVVSVNGIATKIVVP